MDLLTSDQGLEIALDAILNDRLSVICGAGLSMAPPSRIPSAATLAASVQAEYQARYGAARPPLSNNIEEQAEFFFQAGELQTVFLRTLINPHTFEAPPNAGHRALSDLLLVSAVRSALSTNVDTLIETAGSHQFGRVETAVSGAAVAFLPQGSAPLLKVHGCWRADRDQTVWAPGQLAAEPIASRIAENASWLALNLLDRDIVIVGFFTDWAYLNDVLARVLNHVHPSRVVVVDPAAPAAMAAKAPALHALGGRAKHAFGHVQQSGADFLEALRVAFSQSFIRRIAHAGIGDYTAMRGAPPPPALPEPLHSDPDSLWMIRRDLEGCRPNAPATLAAPPTEALLGLTLLQLHEGGATADGPYWSLNGQRVRVIRTPNQFLHRVEATYATDTPPVTSPDIVIAVGAESSGLPASIARGPSGGTITRGAAPQWYTRTEAMGALGL